MHIDDPYGTDEDICMGYDNENVRGGQRRSRARQAGAPAGGRNIDYRVGEEPGKKEPGLDLITDHFSEQKTTGTAGRKEHRTLDVSSTGRSRSRRRTAGTAANAGNSLKNTREQNRGEQKKSDIFRNPAKKKRDKKKKRKIRIILLELFVLLCVIGFAGYSYLTSHLDLMTKLQWDPDKIKNGEISMEKQEQMKGYWTIAVFGVDSRNSSLGSGNNSDVNIICNINQDTGEIKLVSVYRDTYLNISEKNSYNKINAAYLQGGPEQAVMALNKNLDLDIDEYATFNWKAVADAINILGGIDLEISDAEFYYINAFITETVQATGVGSTHLKQAGMNHLDGVQAVAYGRLRLMDSDYARTERQRKVISLAFDKVKQADWNTVNCIIQTVFPQVSTSIDIGDLLTMGRKVTKYHLTETMGFPSARGESTIGKKGACVIPQTLVSNVTELHRFLFGDEAYEPTDTVKAISQKIISDTGKAQEAKPVESVGTGGGVVPKSTEAASETDETSEGEQTETSEAEEIETGPDGEPLETEAEHEVPEEEDEREEETDSTGNLILRPGSSRPGSNAAEESYPGSNHTEGSRPEEPEHGESGEESAAGPTETGEAVMRPGSAVRPGSTVKPTEEETDSSNTSTGVILNPGNSSSSGVEYSGPPGTVQD